MCSPAGGTEGGLEFFRGGLAGSFFATGGWKQLLRVWSPAVEKANYTLTSSEECVYSSASSLPGSTEVQAGHAGGLQMI